jgi:hypothetical protein
MTFLVTAESHSVSTSRLGLAPIAALFFGAYGGIRDGSKFVFGRFQYVGLITAIGTTLIVFRVMVRLEGRVGMGLLSIGCELVYLDHDVHRSPHFRPSDHERTPPQACPRPGLAVGASPPGNRDICCSSHLAPSRLIIIRQPAASQRRAFVVQGATIQHVHVFLVSQG